MLRSEDLRQQANAELAKAKAILDRTEAANLNMSAEEKSEYHQHFQAAADLAEQRKAAVHDESVIAQAKSLADELGLTEAVTDDLDAQTQVPPPGRGGKSLGRTVIESAQYKSLMAQFAGGRVPEKARVESAPIQLKALITGTDPVLGGVLIQPDQLGLIETLGRRPLTVRNLISVRQTGSDAIEYVRQAEHVNNAAPVPEATSSAFPEVNLVAGGYKPEGSWAYERATITVKTIAEWVPATKRALADIAQLQGLIDGELVADLAETEEAQILAGNGVGENLSGILNTSGLQTLPAAGADIFTVVRRAVTRARINGRVAPSAILVNPAQAEAIDLAREMGPTTGAFMAGGPFSGTLVRTLWGIPVVESQALAEGTIVVGDFSKAVLWDRQQATVTVTDSHADFFVRNMVAILAEERVAFAVTRPAAFVVVTL
jgi:HK97 family phage major capsid protein